jgi:hypothetical protein
MSCIVEFVIESPHEATTILGNFMQLLSSGRGDVKASWFGDLLTGWGESNPGCKSIITVPHNLEKNFENYLKAVGIAIIKKTGKETKDMNSNVLSVEVDKKEYLWVYFCRNDKNSFAEDYDILIAFLKSYYQELTNNYKLVEKLEWNSVADSWAFKVPGEKDTRKKLHGYLTRQAKDGVIKIKEGCDPAPGYDYVEVTFIKAQKEE